MHELLGFGIGSVLFPILSYFLFSIVLIIFILIKWRMDHAAKDKDPQVGLKVLLYYFKTIALHVMLAGVVAAAVGIFTDTLSENYSFPLALCSVGVLIYAAHLVLIIIFTNRCSFPTVARYFTAYNIFIVGIATIVSAVMSIIFLVEGDYDSLNTTGAAVIVYSLAWAAQLIILFNIPLFKKLAKK
ncbi:MAG: hypothetical protein JW822_03815 [Spirochaetales bacterium]|nr:hypothetical protein [Spirochaetales bacterium]